MDVEIPIGGVIGYAGSSSGPEVAAALAAHGWLPCDGRALSADLYPELFGVLGTAYGGAAGTFHLPAIPSQNIGTGEIGYLIKSVRAVLG
jgi:microcystin-dependent protein